MMRHRLTSAIKRLVFGFLFRGLEPYVKRTVTTTLLHDHLVFGDSARLRISATAVVNNALFNLSSGRITIEDDVFFGHNVTILTGTHDYAKSGKSRQTGIPQRGRDILIKRGAWIASNATILGPCTIGEDSVVAAGAVVREDVPPRMMVAGVPARVIREIILPETCTEQLQER